MKRTSKKKQAKESLEVQPIPYKKGDVARVYTLMHRGALKAVLLYRDEKGERRKYRPLSELTTLNAEATRRNKEARQHGESYGSTSDAEAAALKVYRDYARQEIKQQRQPVPLLQLIMEGTAAAAARNKTPLFETVREQYLDHLSTLNRTPRHLTTQESRLKGFLDDFDGMQIGDITPVQVQAAITRLTATQAAKTVTNKKVALSSLFAYAVRQGVIAENPARYAEAPAVHATEAPGIITVDDCRLIMHHVRQHIPATLAPVVIALFCGCRRAEIVRMKRGYIDLERRELTIPRSIAKRRQARFVTIPENAAAWLQIALAGVDDPETYIVPGENETERETAYQRILKNIKTHSGAMIPPNAFRHSAASYMCAALQDLPRVALQLGHSVDILNQHYRNIVTERDGRAWFDIVP